MALRLELHYPRVALSEITVLDRVQIPALNTSGTNAGLHYQRMAMAEAVYQKMAAAGIWTDPATKNRMVDDTLAAFELVSIGLTKVIADVNTVEDALVHRVTKGLFDTVEQAETFKFELAQTFTEQATAYEEFQFDLTHYENDTATAQDAARLSVEKWFADSVSTEDTTVVAKIFFLDFIETLLTDDESGFRMLMNRGRDEDATNTADLSNWAIGKFASDVITEVREAHAFELAKALEESVTPTEQFVKNITRPVADTFEYQDSSSFVLSSAKTDTATVPDSSTFELTSAKTDSAVSNDLVYSQAAFDRFFSDTVSLTETIRVDEPQYFGESLGLQDSATIVHIRVATAILNNMQLNQGTLG
jgi:hypothetical protein